MKRYLYSVSLLIGCIDLAATTVTLPDGRAYSVSDWGPAVSIKVPADKGGEMDLIKRASTITKTDRIGATYPVEFVYKPVGRQFLLSTPGDQYLAMESRIYGIRVEGTRVLIRTSVTADDAQPEDAIILEALRSFLQDPMADDYGQNAGVIDLEHLFGTATLQPLTSQYISKTFRINSVRVENASFTLSADTLEKNSIEVTLDDRLNVVGAKRNGEPVLVLTNGKRSSDKPLLVPRGISVPAAIGNVKLILGRSSFAYTDKAGIAHDIMVTAAINPATGGVWFSADDCMLAMLGSKIIGATMDGKTDLLFYSQYGQMALTGNTINSFQSLLGNFCDKLRDGTFKESLRISLTDLPELPKAESPAFDLRQVDIRDSQLRVLLRVPFPDKFAELRFAENLKLLSAKLRPQSRD